MSNKISRYNDKADVSFGRLLLELKKITPKDAERVLRTQKVEGKRFGDTALALGLITQQDILQVLSMQFDYPYLQTNQANFSPELIAAYDPFSAQVEALRALRTQLMLRWFAEFGPSLSIVSTQSGDGTSYLAANLAVVFSQLGENTLLIDANLRQPRIRSIFNLNETRGLSDILAERASNETIIKIETLVGLSVLGAGTVPPNPQELLSRPTFTNLMTYLSNIYDVIIVDTPAADEFVDYQSIIARTRGALLVSRKNHTKLANLTELSNQIKGVGFKSSWRSSKRVLRVSMRSPLFASANAVNAALKYALVLLGLLFLYIPTYYSLANHLWNTEDQAHGPLILMVVIYLFWSNRESFLNSPEKPNYIIGWPLFLTGLLLYIVGRSQSILVFEIGSQLFVLSGLILMIKGFSALRAMWFPIFFIFFMIPLPGSLVASITLPMKLAVSYVAQHILFWLDYPISRNGVILEIGQYQLLVADACAGLHTLISLEALGLLYLNVVKHDSFIRNVALAILVVPISFVSNVIRVMILSLVTYYFGDAAGQGFVHSFAGMLLFVVALTLIISTDTILQTFIKWRAHQSKRAAH